MIRSTRFEILLKGLQRATLEGLRSNYFDKYDDR
jgi:hypothetical protein